ncbi:arylsulfatase [Bradyrhizobium barranii subsp. barranii]|uniref:Arylsulfatase n=2 Tax=Bradyrhizobium barranii subsp. barranii TaxID=2823807 RepID=A0A9X9YG92_9BRAD|nr:arylsulfatase [Bradyrhizobium barranii]UGX89947.1 arylsulfatase [Bradyrhizobium barranii subsp. barranii]
MSIRKSVAHGMFALFGAMLVAAPQATAQQQKRPNVVMLMTDDTGWNDFGAYSGGGAALGHPTPNIDRIAKEGATFTNWYGQASCTAGRASFITGRIPIRSALSIVVAPGDENALKKETPTIAEFFQKNGYSTYFSGKWHLGDKPESYPIEHGFDEMKAFAAYYPGVYTYADTSKWFHPWFPSYNPEIAKAYFDVVNMYEWEGVAGQPAKRGEYITYDYLANFDVRQADYAIDYIKKHAKDAKPFFMDVNFMKMHNPTNASSKFAGKSRLGDYSDSVIELDDDIGRIMDAIRAEAPNTIVIVTADNGAWQDAYPDAGTTPFRGEKGSAFEGGWRVPGLMWWPEHIPAGANYHEMMSHIDCWATLAKMVGLSPPPHGAWTDDNGRPIYFDSIDNSEYILGRAKHSARRSWIYIDGESFMGARADVGGDPTNPDLSIAWKYLWTAKDTWLGPEQNLGAIGSVYNLTMDPFEKYDMVFNGAMSARMPLQSPGKYTGQDNGWVLALIFPVVMEFNKSIVDYPSIKRKPGGASNDWRPDLQRPENPIPMLDMKHLPNIKGSGG